ncbi:high affinity immunoglobulin gamma Fc receptor I-like, partial [Acipenser oxyrinchus oxyrinchus]
EWVTLQTEPQPVFEGDTLTLRCLIRDGSTVKWVYFYKDNTVLKYQRGTEPRVYRVSKNQDGIYKCSATWWSGTIYSAEVRVSVRVEWVTLQTEPQPVFEGDTLTLRCLIRDGSTVKWVYFYKDNRELKYQRGTELRVDHVSKKQDGIYKCSVTWRIETIYSAEVRVSVRDQGLPKVLSRWATYQVEHIIKSTFIKHQYVQ